MLISDYSGLVPVDIKCQFYRAYLGPLASVQLRSEVLVFVHAEGF